MSSPIPARTPRPAAAGTTPTPGRTARARLALIVGLGEGPARAIRLAGLIAAGTVAVGAFLPWATGSDQSDNPGSYLIAGVSTFDGVFILVLGVIAGVLVARRTITGLLLSLVPFAVTAWTAVDVIAEPWTLAVDDSESIRGRALAGLFVTAAGGFAGVTLVVIATTFLATTTVQISRGVSPVHAPARIGALICGAATAVTAFLPWVQAPRDGAQSHTAHPVRAVGHRGPPVRFHPLVDRMSPVPDPAAWTAPLRLGRHVDARTHWRGHVRLEDRRYRSRRARRDRGVPAMGHDRVLRLHVGQRRRGQ